MSFTGHAIGSGGVRIALHEWGAADGPAVVLIHGFCQSAQAFEPLRHQPLARSCRLVACDLRGHGLSDKPLDPALYRQGAIWADDLAAVLEAARVENPVLVAWSYAGSIVGEYLNRHGSAGIGGINFVGAATRVAPEWFGPARMHVPGMLAEDPGQRLESTRSFVKAVHHVALDKADFEATVGSNMLVPVEARRGMTGRPFDMQLALQALQRPVLVTHGVHDAVILPEMGRWTAAMVPGAALSLYESAGHTPFRDDPKRFGAELEALVARVIRGAGVDT